MSFRLTPSCRPAFQRQRVTYRLLALVVAAVLVACGGGGTQPVATASPVATPTVNPPATAPAVAKPTIDGIAPASGKASGGTTVTLTGTNLTGATGVTFGGAAGTGLTVVSATRLTVTTPAGTAGARDVSVTTPGGTVTSVGAFTYVPSTISTFAGTSAGFSGDGATATAAQLSGPQGAAFDAAGNLYIADTTNHRIRVVCKTSGTYFGIAMTAGNIYTIAGTTSGMSGDGGPATAAQFSGPRGVALDAAGNLYIADQGNNRIRVINQTPGTYFGIPMTAGNIYTVAGGGASGDGALATAAQLSSPYGIAFDTTGNLFITDTGSHRIRVINHTPGTYFGVAMTANNIYTVAGVEGAGAYNGDGIAATTAWLRSPSGIAFDNAGNLYIADNLNHRIRAVARTSGTFFGVAMTADRIYTVAGTTNGLSGDGAAASAAQFSRPWSLAFDTTGNLYVADFNNNRLRAICHTSGTYFGVPMTAGNIYMVAGYTFGSSGDGGPGTASQLAGPTGIAFDTAGHLYVVDYGNHRIRTISP